MGERIKIIPFNLPCISLYIINNFVLIRNAKIAYPVVDRVVNIVNIYRIILNKLSLTELFFIT